MRLATLIMLMFAPQTFAGEPPVAWAPDSPPVAWAACVCGTSCTCAPGACPSRCPAAAAPVAAPVPASAPAIVGYTYRRVCTGTGCTLVREPVYR